MADQESKQVQQIVQDDDSIDIAVTEPMLQNSQIDKHTLYSIKGKDKLGPFEIQRRFKDFQALREVLLIKWPGCFVPGLPGRKLFHGNEIKTINDRLKFLNAFCSKLSRLQTLYYSQEVSQLFLRSKEKDIYKTLESMHKPNSVELIQKYQIHFQHLSGKDIDQELFKKIDDFGEQIKQNQEQLRKAKKFVKETLESQDNINKSTDHMMNITIPDYERQFISQYCQSEKQLLFSNEENKSILKQNLKSEVIFRRINLWLFLDLLRLELKDCKAFLYQIKVRQEYEDYRKKLEQKAKDLQLEFQNASQGKTGLKNIFNRDTPEQIKANLQLQIQNTQNEIENIKNLLDIIAAILGFIEIDKFQQEKKSNYEEILQQLQQMETISLEEQKQYWTFIQEQSSKLQKEFQIKMKKNQIEQQQIKQQLIQEIQQQYQEQQEQQQQQQQEQQEQQEQYEQQEQQEQQEINEEQQINQDENQEDAQNKSSSDSSEANQEVDLE